MKATDRSRLASDPYRPGYHYLPPANWMNDPHGGIFWKGQYHLFYQHNPNGAFHGGRTGAIHWGHAVTEDFVHWQDLPIALAPTPDGPDRNNCASGGAFINREGTPTLIYHGVPDGICIATSHDDMLVNWEKHPANPVIPAPAPRGEYKVEGACFAWIEGDTYYAITGNSSREAFDGEEPDRAYLFRSKDLLHWEYMHPFYEGGRYTEGGEDCSVPDFFPLGDKHVLFFASHIRGAQCYIGTYADHRFIPERHKRLAFGEGRVGMRPGILCECQTLPDESGRRVLFGRLSEGRYGYVQRASGWSGILALPMRLALSGEGELLLEPVEELQALRGEPVHVGEIHLDSDETVVLDDVRGNRLEIRAVFEWESAEEFGLGICCSAGGEEQTLIRFNTNPNALNRAPDVLGPGRQAILDISRSSVSPTVSHRGLQQALVDHPYGEPVELRIFIDRSVVEVFVGDRHYLGRRIYPARPDSLGVQVFSKGGTARLNSLDAWPMKAIWPIET